VLQNFEDVNMIKNNESNNSKDELEVRLNYEINQQMITNINPYKQLINISANIQYYAKKLGRSEKMKTFLEK
jgi:hypothetical protein